MPTRPAMRLPSSTIARRSARINARRANVRSPDLRLTLLAAALVLAGCAHKDTLPGDDQPTLKTLAGREYEVGPDNAIAPDEEQAMEAYRRFLAAAPKAPQRPQAMRRLGDLAMEAADAKAANPAVNAPAGASD